MRYMNMARILNLIIVIMEIIAFFKEGKIDKHSPKNLIFYTRISNLLTFVSSLLLVIFGQKAGIEVFRFLSVCMMVMSFLVAACILAPVTGKVKDLLFSGTGLFHHLLIPALSFISYIFAEDRASFGWVWLPIAVTLIYGSVLLYLNKLGKIEGPYPFFSIKKIGLKKSALSITAILLSVSLVSVGLGYHKPLKTNIKLIFVHGLSGWGSYDAINEFFPYWGLSGGSVIRYLNNRGYDSYAASVDPTGSAWDRACELYAQLAGTRVDYGAAHSSAAGHDRFGEDFTGRALIYDFSSSKIALIGHSFGGATIRLFSEILRNGSAEERAFTDEADLSPFFKGGNGDGLTALVTLAAPTNGTTAYDMYEDPTFKTGSIEVPDEYEKNSGLVSKGTKPDYDSRKLYDYASYDMHIDNAIALNNKISTFEDVYYFAYPCSSTVKNGDGSFSPDPSITENIFMKGAIYMSNYTGTTKGGFVIDETWQPNDGLVNTVSAGAPLGAPNVNHTEGMTLKPGLWHVMPTTIGDHMYFQCGFTKRVNVKPFYLKLAEMLASL